MVALKLNEYESHRHASQYNMSLIVKRFSFVFVNSYLTLLYLLFVDRVRAVAVGMTSRPRLAHMCLQPGSNVDRSLVFTLPLWWVLSCSHGRTWSKLAHSLASSC